jgi:prevent-host-death family protein
MASRAFSSASSRVAPYYFTLNRRTLMVISVSVAELKARLSHYLRMVRAGRDVIVTDRGVPVARLCPVDSAFPDARTTALCRAGLARPPRRALPPDFWERPRPADPEGRALAALLEERAEGR